MELGLKGKNFIIAGSSRGIGRAIGESLLAEGANVLISGRHQPALNKARSEMNALRLPGKVAAFRADMKQPAQIARCLRFCADHFVGLHGVVANLGSGKGTMGIKATDAEWKATLELNLFAAVRLARAAWPFLKGANGGAIVFISSVAGWESIHSPLAYGVAKNGLIHLTKKLSNEFASKNVRVNTVVPGNIVFPGGRWENKLRKNPSVVKAYIKREVPLGRFGSPDEIAGAVTFLLSQRASFITGSCLVIDGGQTRSS